MAKRMLVKGGRRSGYFSMHSIRCAWCHGLLCRGEGFRVGRYLICGPCRQLWRETRPRLTLDQGMLDRRDASRLQREHCEREGACQLRLVTAPLEPTGIPPGAEECVRPGEGAGVHSPPDG